MKRAWPGTRTHLRFNRHRASHSHLLCCRRTCGRHKHIMRNSSFYGRFWRSEASVKLTLGALNAANDYPVDGDDDN